MPTAFVSGIFVYYDQQVLNLVGGCSDTITPRVKSQNLANQKPSTIQDKD
jgi:hypothetical protein